MLRLRVLALICLCATGSRFLLAQAPGTGLYSFGSFDNRGFDIINIAISIRILRFRLLTRKDAGRTSTTGLFMMAYCGQRLVNQEAKLGNQITDGVSRET